MALWLLPGGFGQNQTGAHDSGLGIALRFGPVNFRVRVPTSNAAMASMAAGDTVTTRAWPFTWARSPSLAIPRRTWRSGGPGSPARIGPCHPARRANARLLVRHPGPVCAAGRCSTIRARLGCGAQAQVAGRGRGVRARAAWRRRWPRTVPRMPKTHYVPIGVPIRDRSTSGRQRLPDGKMKSTPPRYYRLSLCLSKNPFLRGYS